MLNQVEPLVSALLTLMGRRPYPVRLLVHSTAIALVASASPEARAMALRVVRELARLIEAQEE